MTNPLIFLIGNLESVGWGLSAFSEDRYQVFPYLKIDDAIEELLGCKPDLIIAELNLDDAPSIAEINELLQAMRDYSPDTQLICLTDHISELRKLTCQAMGVRKLLPKNDAVKLLNEIKELLNKAELPV